MASNTIVLEPRYRYALKGSIHIAGFKTLGEFSNAVGVDISRLSRIIQGREIPSLDVQKRMAEQLNLSFHQFQELL